MHNMFVSATQIATLGNQNYVLLFENLIFILFIPSLISINHINSYFLLFLFRDRQEIKNILFFYADY